MTPARSKSVTDDGYVPRKVPAWFLLSASLFHVVWFASMGVVASAVLSTLSLAALPWHYVMFSSYVGEVGPQCCFQKKEKEREKREKRKKKRKKKREKIREGNRGKRKKERR